MKAPLAGLRVLDLTRYVAGPHATQMLGDMGADVVKVEGLPQGEGSRRVDRTLGEPDALFFITHNRNKRSVALDLRSEEGRSVLAALAGQADVLVENFRPGVLERLGLAPDALETANPRLVLARISGFGQDGPWADRASYDPVIQALSGLMELTGEPDGPPMTCGTVITDYLTALHAVVGILAALQSRARTGRGEWVDVSMLDAASTVLMSAVPEYLLTGRERTRQGNKNPVGVPSHTFRCRDGRWVHFTAWLDGEFRRLCRAMGEPGLAEDPRFRDIPSRWANDAELEGIIARWMAGLDSAEVERRLLAERLAAARVATIGELARNPQLAHRGQIREVEHPLQGRVPVSGPALRFAGEVPGPDLPRVPLLGEHSRAVLRQWLGWEDARIDALRDAGTLLERERPAPEAGSGQ